MSLRVIVTGTTGNLGAYILDSLLSLPQISQIVCLNRAADAKSRQQGAHRARGLIENLDLNRVSFVKADFTDPYLGLSRVEYQELASSSNIFIHNAWSVNFNQNIRSFKPLIEGVKYVIDFCQFPTTDGKGDQPIKLLFVSSIGATSNWGSAAPTSRSSVAEAEIEDWKVARTGYGQSKLLSERLLCLAAANHGHPVAIIRVGQLCGPVLRSTKGKWPEQEWIPSIIKSSIYLGALPETLGPTEEVDWVPADIAARVMTEVAVRFAKDLPPETGRRFRKKKAKAQFYHLVNPQRSTWARLLPAMRDRMPPAVKTVPFVEWVNLLKRSVEDAGGYEGVNEGLNPAGKLIDLFDNLQDRAIRFPHARVAPLETVQTVKISETLRQLQAVNPGWMELFMQQWNWSENQKFV